MTGRFYQSLVCVFIGHNDKQVILPLGKISTEEVKADRCTRCGRISILKSELNV